MGVVMRACSLYMMKSAARRPLRSCWCPWARQLLYTQTPAIHPSLCGIPSLTIPYIHISYTSHTPVDTTRKPSHRIQRLPPSFARLPHRPHSLTQVPTMTSQRDRMVYTSSPLVSDAPPLPARLKPVCAQ